MATSRCTIVDGNQLSHAAGRREGIEPNRYSVAAVYDRRQHAADLQDRFGVIDRRYRIGLAMRVHVMSWRWRKDDNRSPVLGLVFAGENPFLHGQFDWVQGESGRQIQGGGMAGRGGHDGRLPAHRHEENAARSSRMYRAAAKPQPNILQEVTERTEKMHEGETAPWAE